MTREQSGPRATRPEAGSARPTIIAMTGDGVEGDVEHSAQAGFDLHLVKPVSPTALVAVLDGIAATLLVPA